MNRPRIYISGPITKGDKVHNFAQAARAQEMLISHGFAPLNPMMTMMHPCAAEIPYEHWIDSDLAWIEVADAVLRLPGESHGALRECAFAEMRDIPVFNSIGQLIDWRDKKPVAL